MAISGRKARREWGKVVAEAREERQKPAKPLSEMDMVFVGDMFRARNGRKMMVLNVALEAAADIPVSSEGDIEIVRGVPELCSLWERQLIGKELLQAKSDFILAF